MKNEILPEQIVPSESSGSVELAPEGANGYGEYKYRVIGRNGVPSHHTNDKQAADEWLKECMGRWVTSPQNDQVNRHSGAKE